MDPGRKNQIWFIDYFLRFTLRACLRTGIMITATKKAIPPTICETDRYPLSILLPAKTEDWNINIREKVAIK